MRVNEKQQQKCIKFIYNWFWIEAISIRWKCEWNKTKMYSKKNFGKWSMAWENLMIMKKMLHTLELDMIVSLYTDIQSVINEPTKIDTFQ